MQKLPSQTTHELHTLHFLNLNQSNAKGNNSHNENISSRDTSVGNTTFEAQRLAKLPTAELPKFDGNFENWLSFKNMFKSLIDGRKDLDDVNKLYYLRSSLTGAASNKLSLYDASAENYTKAWDLLTETYQKERALVNKHYDALLDLDIIEKPTNENLTKFIDQARQHLNELETLNAKPTDAFIVRVLERKLPIYIRDKWEETFDNENTLSTIEQFGKFVTKTAFRFSSRKPNQHHDTGNSFKRKRTDRTFNANKSQKTEPTARALVTSPLIACPYCKGNHPLYKCPNFNSLTVDQRVKFVKASRLCPNCLRKHKGPCTSIHCKLCHKFHHTMLHYKQNSNTYTNQNKNAKPNANKAESFTVTPAAKESTS
ncbi:uncharacterized protein LOC123272198 [Cotesia glomerata]|uniref:uncharacterized protein LOC123272198 n=1 Tax=Cotesia glomerata TaxID=32391 RepID=UPI001D035AC0|nr:uncharacterized protein LOC123272198 [Cotesia glomerata]